MDLAKVVNLSQCVNTLSQSVLNDEAFRAVGEKTKEVQLKMLETIATELSTIKLV